MILVCDYDCFLDCQIPIEAFWGLANLPHAPFTLIAGSFAATSILCSFLADVQNGLWVHANELVLDKKIWNLKKLM